MPISAGALCALAAIAAVVAEGSNAAPDASGSSSTVDKVSKQMQAMRDNEMQESEMKALQTCRIGEGEACSLANMPRGQSTLVYPGGSTRCLSANEPDYFFQVVPGHPDKLVVQFQGGGACWNEFTAGFACSTSGRPDKSGIFDLSRDDNPVRDYTIVNVVYCSGDVHTGMANTTFGPQAGFANSMSALTWARDNLPDVDSLLISGSSAGSLAVQLLSGFILNMFEGRYSRATVVADSFAGVSPPGAQAFLTRQWNFCATPPVIERGGEIVAGCQAGNLTIQDFYIGAMQAFPAVPFASISAKTDIVQILYWNLIVEVENFPGGLIEGIRLFAEVNKIFDRYNEQPNYISYVINGLWHVFLELDTLYTADPSGERSNGLVARPKLTDWLTGLLSQPTVGQGPNEGGPSGSVCLGPNLPRSYWSKLLAGVLYCDKAQRDKTASFGDDPPLL